MTSMIHGKGNGPATEQMLRPRHLEQSIQGRPRQAFNAHFRVPIAFDRDVQDGGKLHYALDGNDGNDGYDGNIAAAEGVKAVDGVLWGGKFSLSGSSKQMPKTNTRFRRMPRLPPKPYPNWTHRSPMVLLTSESSTQPGGRSYHTRRLVPCLTWTYLDILGERKG